mgnify:CR=1 FL=1
MEPITITLCLLVFAIVMFIWEKVPLAVTSMVVCVALVVTGVLDLKQAFAGFIDSNVILFVAMFIVGELLTYVWSREGMHDALWLAYIATFIKQWGLTSATGFMWALVPEVIAYGELKSGKRNSAIINAIMGLFFKIGFTIGGAIPLWLLAVYGFNESGAVQSASAIDGIIMTAVWIPIALAAISMVIMQVYPISDKHVTDINRQLDEIRV